MHNSKVMVVLEEHEEIASEALDMLEKENIELSFKRNDDSSPDSSEHTEAEAVLVRGASIDRMFIENMPHLKVIGRCGVGTDNIDIQSASENNVYVCNVPDGNFISVSEHVLGLIIALSHQTVKADKALRQGDFEARHRYQGHEVNEKTLGVIGFGKIGQTVADKCIQSLNMNVLAYDPYVDMDKDRVHFVASVNDVFEASDYITLHLPYNDAFHHFVDEHKLQKMKETAFIINCARGGLIDENALAHAVRHHDIAGAGIDVFEHEPPSNQNPLFDLENVIVTPHMAASTQESLTRMATGAAADIIRVLQGKSPHNPVN